MSSVLPNQIIGFITWYRVFEVMNIFKKIVHQEMTSSGVSLDSRVPTIENQGRNDDLTSLDWNSSCNTWEHFDLKNNLY